MSNQRVYTKGSLKVLWESDLCTHCEACWRGLPSVFQPESRPWVDMEGSSQEAIIRQVMQCPSGALSIFEGENNG